MLLGGLWHGAAWTFVAWGALHGAGQVVGHVRRGRRIERGLRPLPDSVRDRARQRVVTFHLVCLGWVFFRADSVSTALHLLGRLGTGFASAPLVTPLVLLAITVGIGIQYIPSDAPERMQVWFSAMRPVAQGAVLGFVLFLITTLGPQGVAPFIYFRF
jgi:hypothetical protein